MRTHAIRIILALVFVIAAGAQPARAGVDSLFIVPGSHLDVGFTDLPSALPATRVAILDDAIATAKREPDFHWTEDAGWVFEQWMNVHRNDAGMMQAVRYLLHNGQLSISAAYLTPHTAVIPELQSMLTIHLPALASEFDYHPTVAILNDVPSHPQAMIDALVSHGVKYLLVGANMGFSRGLPAKLIRTPFYWESEKGNRILTYVDPNNYCGAFQLFGLGPDCAKYFNPQRFPASLGRMETMQAGLNDLLVNSPATYDALVLQHAYDNWNTTCAKDLLRGAREWNARRNTPVIVLASPEEYFHHVESKYGGVIPVYREEWGGQWDEIRAVSPVWTWRIREAAKAIAKHPTYRAQADVLLAMEHNVHLGEIWPKFFDEKNVRAYADECTAMFAAAVKDGTPARDALTRVPPKLKISGPAALTPDWKALLGRDRPLRIRSGAWPGTPFVVADAPEWNTPVKYGVETARIAANIHIDRRAIPGSDQRNVSVAVEIPLHASIAALRIAPEESPEALRDKWLRPPQFVIAADGIRVQGLARELTVRSPLIFSWMLVPDDKDPNITWLQGMIVRQTLFCQLKGGATKVLPFEAWFPGEPAVIDIGVEVVMR